MKLWFGIFGLTLGLILFVGLAAAIASAVPWLGILLLAAIPATMVANTERLHRFLDGLFL